ncbi:MAG: DUF975 family protein [Eubacteriales bacterium]|nr:DUF975 family protein [Eubacteriales bacterium]
MWQRVELKSRAKQTVGRTYWRSVLAALILMICTGGLSVVNSASNAYSSVNAQGDDVYYNFGGMLNGRASSLQDARITLLVLGTLVVAMSVASLAGIAVRVFLLAPLEVGCQSFFIRNRMTDARIGEIGQVFRGNYLNVVKTQFLRSLFTFLWTLLLVIPGIVKGYEYRMIPYILAENPNMDYREAFRLSREMMDGEKWNAFVLDLSFLGWNILSALTCNILGIFYVDPYKANTDAELYAVLKDKLFGGAARPWES